MVGLAVADASGRQRRIAASVAIVLVVTTAFVAARARTPLPTIGPFLAIFGTIAGSSDALTAYLLATQARVSRSWSLFVLACGYFFAAVVIGPHLLTFPGVFSPHGLLGAGTQTAVYFWVWWHGGFPAFVLASSLAWRRGSRVPGNARLTAPRIALAGAAIVAFVALLLEATIAGQRHLPTLIEKGNYGLLIATGIGPAVLCAIGAALGALVVRTRLRNATHLWVAVALVAMFCDCALTLVAGGRYTAGWYLARIESLIATTVVLLAYLATIGSMFDRLAALSNVDGLTDLANRRAFDERLEHVVALANRTRTPVSLVMLDVDAFKKFNDAYGHPSGDEALRIVAACIGIALPRLTDLGARYGGEEFAAILPATDAVGAARVAERIRGGVERCGVPHRDGAYGVLTVSVGIATKEPGEARDGAIEALIARADEALYRAKAAGGNRVALADRERVATAPVPAALTS